MKLDLDAAIVPARSAGGFRVGDSGAALANVKPPPAIEVLGGCKKYDFGAVAVWVDDDDRISQVGLVRGYRGAMTVGNATLVVGAPLAALEVFGEIGIDDDENWVVRGLRGVVFDIARERVRGIYVHG